MSERAYWVGNLIRVTGPVFDRLSRHLLRKDMPIEARPGHEESRVKCSHLEALGRAFCGVAPWLELAELEGEEASRRDLLLSQVLDSLRNAVDPDSPDRMIFNEPHQALVDAAFLALGLLRAPQSVWRKLNSVTQSRLVAALLSSREIIPGFNNWLLFSATIEAFLHSIGEKWDGMRVDYALRQHEQWYCGDGAYADGPNYHWDYYNSFVIQPMLLDILAEVSGESARWGRLYELCLERGKRYAAIQERMIGPDGSFPPLGRSLAYRGGAFHHLARAALTGELPAEVAPEQVRCALTAVLRRTLDAEGTFDKNGWLRIGLAGHQPDLAEGYISTGSLYLSSAIFLPLGLPPSHPFWAGPESAWTSRKIWSGEDCPADHALHDQRGN